MLRLRVFVFVICAVSFLNSEAQNSRFIHRVFTNVSVTEEVLFSSGDNYLGVHKDLYFDFYEPSNDTMELRPLVIEVFGGAFVQGNRQWADMLAYGDSLASYGYTVAAIDYRLGFNPLSGGSIIRAAYRACQDVNAAIRFFKANYAEYRIDTTQIFLLGNSAGTIASLLSVYLEEDERPEETYNNGLLQDDLGCIHCTGDYQNHTNDVAGIVAQWGGLDDLNYIDDYNDTPVCFIHGTGDSTVPCDSGFAYNNIEFLSLPYLYGSKSLSMKLDSLETWHELHLFENASHCFYLENLISMIPDSFSMCLNITVDFLAQINNYVENPVNISRVDKDSFTIFPNPANNILFIETNDDLFTYKLLSSDGRILISDTKHSKATIPVNNYTPGIYLIEIRTEKGAFIEKVLIN
ncbi:MAG: T9SS type A sorting domain-containing protein [Bacteroidales bacterium]|jgi:hypothetical protein|nr:T9SS type A sorting domain-containing protein [Bacteroidales bacterium]MDY0160099.1 T9SS type A sorting domain-containing protein [Bacteroidales bacterium]